MTNDVCFVDVMETAVLKTSVPTKVFAFYDTEKRLLGNKWSLGVLNNRT